MTTWRVDRGGLTAPVFPQSYFDGQNFPALQPLSAGITNYSIDANGVSYSLSVGDVTLTAARTIDANAASYTLTIGDAGLQKGLNFDASGASYALTIGDVTLTVARTIGADAPSYALSVGNVALTADRTIAADAATYVLSIGDVTLDKTSAGAYNLDCDPLALTLTIGDVGLEYNSLTTPSTSGGTGWAKPRTQSRVWSGPPGEGYYEIQRELRKRAEKELKEAGFKPRRAKSLAKEFAETAPDLGSSAQLIEQISAYTSAEIKRLLLERLELEDEEAMVIILAMVLH